MSVKIKHKYIYEQEVKEEQFYGDKNFSEIIQHLGYLEDFTHIVSVNPETQNVNEVPKQYWNYITPKGGEYFIMQTPAGDSKQLLGMVLTIAAIASGQWYLTEVIGLTGGYLVAAQVALSVGVSFLVNAIVPYSPPTASTVSSPSESTTLGISGTRNEVRPGAPVPYHIGTSRFVPPLAAQAVREVNGQDIVMRQVFLAGYAPLKITDLQIGDTPIENFDDVDIQINDGYENSDQITAIKGDITSQTNLSITLNQNDPQIVTGGIDAEEADIVFAFQSGLVSIADSGAYNTRQVDLRVEYRKVGDTEWIQTTPPEKYNITTVKNTSAVVVPTAADYTYTWNYTESYVQFNDGLPVWMTVGKSFRILGSQRNSGLYTAYSIVGDKVYVSDGALRYKNVSGKSLEDETVIDATINADGAGTVGSFAYTGATAQQTYRTFNIPHLEKAQYEFQITRTNAESSSNRVKDEITLIDVKTTQLTDASGDPLVIFPDKYAYIGVVIRANEQLNGTINQLSCKVQSVPERWDSVEESLVEDITESGNPAWEYLSMLSGKAGAMKVPIPISNLDLDEISSWADRCNEDVNGKPRHRINHVVDYSTRVDELMTKITSIGRASKSKIDGKYSVIQDVGGRAATQKFTPANSFGFSATKSFIQRPDAFRCQWVNPDKDWSVDYTEVLKVDGSGTPDIVEDLDCLGITDVDEVYRYAKFAHAQLELRPEEYTLKTGIESLRSTRGDIVIVSHDKIQGDVSFGRVTAFSGSVITLDNGATLTAGSKFMSFRHSLGTQSSVAYQVLSQSTKDYTINADVSAIPDLAIGDLCMIGNSVEAITSKYIIKEVTHQEDFIAELILVDYADPDIYTSESGVIPDYVATVSKPGLNEFKRPVTPVIDSVYSDEKALKVNPDGSLKARIAVDISYPTDDTLPVPTHIRMGYRVSGSDDYYLYEPAKELTGTTYFCNDVQEGSSYDIRVSLISGNSIESESVMVTNEVVTGKTNPPEDVTGLAFSKAAGVYSLTWDANTDVDFKEYVLYKEGEEFLRTTGTSTNLSNVTTGTNTYTIKAIDTSGNFSVNFGTEAFVATAAAPVITSSESGTDRLILNADGSLNSRIFLEWTSSEPANGFNVRYKLPTDTSYTYTQVAELNTYIENVQEGGTYEIGIQARSITAGVVSNWTTINYEVVGKSQPPSDVTTGAITLEDRNIILAWGAITDLDVKEYEIRKGTTWASATFVTRVQSTSWSRPADVTGDHTWLVKAIDTSNLESLNAKSLDLTINAPTAPVVTSQVVDNNVLLRYESVNGTLPVAEYEVERGGTVIGSGANTFSVVFETTGGVYTYNITAIDIAGNRSNTTAHVATVKSPPDYVLNALVDSAFGGTYVNSHLDTTTAEDLIFLPSAPTGQTWADYLAATPAYTTLTPEIIAGYTGWLTPTDGALASYQEVYDYGQVLVSSLVTVTPTYEVNSGSLPVDIKLEGSTDNVIWTDYGLTGGGSLLLQNFRYVRYTISVTPTTDAQYTTISGIKLRLDVKLGSDFISGTANAVDVGGTTFQFTTAFVDVTGITVTPKAGGSAVYGLYDFVDIPNPTEFQVLLYNSSGTRVSGEFSANIGGFI